MKNLSLVVLSTLACGLGACSQPHHYVRSVEEFMQEPELLHGVVLQCNARVEHASTSASASTRGPPSSVWVPPMMPRRHPSSSSSSNATGRRRESLSSSAMRQLARSRSTRIARPWHPTRRPRPHRWATLRSVAPDGGPVRREVAWTPVRYSCPRKLLKLSNGALSPFQPSARRSTALAECATTIGIFEQYFVNGNRIGPSFPAGAD